MQELFSQLEIEHPNLFNTNTLEGRKFINDYYKFFEMEKKQIIDSFKEGTKFTDINDEFNAEFNGIIYYNETYKNYDN